MLCLQYAMQAVERIEHRNLTKNFWLHVAFQAVHGGNHRSETDSCDLLSPGTGAAAQDGYRNAGYGNSTTQYLVATVCYTNGTAAPHRTRGLH